MILFPAIDIINGKCVRLKQGDFNQQTEYQQDPVELANSWYQQGATHLHFVDLDAARTGTSQNLHILEKICNDTKLEVDFGGGIKSKEALISVLSAGARKVNIGSMAVNDPQKFADLIEKFSSQIILSMDLKNDLVAVNGWQEQSELKAADLLNRHPQLQYVSVTDITKDGMLAGPNLELYKNLIWQFPQIKLIASGGVSSLEDLQQLNEAGLYGAIAGKAILEGRFNISEALNILE